MVGKTPESGTSAPVTAHPFFPAIVALWFAALLGIGSLVLPVALFETAVTVSGIDKLVPATTPPLGFTARLLIAAACAGLGALAGLWIASKVVASQGETNTARTRRVRHSHTKDTDARRPISAHEELGGDSIDDVAGEAEKPHMGRRRALTVTDESGPSEYFDFAPLPGSEAMRAELYAAEDAPDDDQPIAEDALELGGFDADPSPQEPESGDFASPTPVGDYSDLEALRTGATAAPLDTMPFTNSEDSRSEDAPMTSDINSPADFSGGSPGSSQAIPFGARPAAPEHSSIPQGQAFAAPQTGQAPAQPAMPQPAFSGQPAFSDQNAAPNQQAFQTSATQDAGFAEGPATAAIEPSQSDRIDTIPLADLGMVELVERFARALQQGEGPSHAAQASPQPGAIPFGARKSDAQQPASFEAPPAPAQIAEEQKPAPQFAATQAVAPPDAAIPSALRPLDIGHDEDDEDDEYDQTIEALSLNLQSTITQPAQSPAASFAGQFATATPQAAAPFSQPGAAPAEPAHDFGAAPVATQATQTAPTEQPSRQEFAQNAQDAFAQPPLAADAPDGTDDENEAYSSLLDMRGPLGPGREFVRVEDEAPNGDEGVVVFPGQSERRAAPAADGPARDPAHCAAPSAPADAARPFDAPAGIGSQSSAADGDSREAEQALRAALEKLNRMSGAA